MLRRLSLSLLTLTLVGTLGACGSSAKTSSAATTAAVVTTAASATTAATTAAPAATTAAPAATTAAPPKASGTALACAAAPAADATAVSLVEWSIKAPATLKAGAVHLTVTNAGANSHEFVVIKGDSFDALPKAANGSVDESKLAAGALVGRTEKLAAGKACSTTVDLAPGKYVMVCNISFGAISHAAKGQVAVVEVTA